MAGPDPGRLLLDKIEAREQALAREAEQARTMMDDLAARVRELDEAIDHLQITRKTLLSLADEPGTGPEPAEPPPALPGHPLYQQILAVFADTARPMRARDLCQALDLPIAPKNTENIRSKLKRLTSSPEKRMIRRGPADASWNELHATSWLTSTDCVGLRVIRGRLQPTR